MDMLDALVQPFYEVPGRILSLHKNEYLFHEGSAAQYFYFVHSGQIRISKSADSGRILSLRLAHQGSIIGELPLYQKNRVYIFDAIAKTEAEVYAIEYPVLERNLEQRPQLAINMLKLMAKHMRKQHHKFRDLLLYGKKGAVYSTLIRMANSYGREENGGVLIPLEMTNQELADYSAMSRESLNRLLSEMKRDGIIAYRGNFIFLQDMEYLRQEVRCESCGAEDCIIE
jgi:anaerobic regulatory protein